MPEEPDSLDSGTTTINEDVALLETPEVSSESDYVEEPQGEVTEPESSFVQDEETEETTEEPPQEGHLEYYDRPSITDIKTKYPKFFKDFPDMQHMLFREKEFATLFPSVEDAREAASNSEAFTVLQDKVLSGDAKGFLEAVNEADSKALGKFSENLLDGLREINPNVHWQAIVPTLEQVCRALYNEGKSNNNENQQYAAQYLSKFLFNDDKVATGEKTFAKPKEKPDELKHIDTERMKLQAERYTSFRADVEENALSQLSGMIGTKEQIDPEGIISKWAYDKILEDTIREVNSQMVSDKEHMRYMDSLWTRGGREGYSKDLKTRITSAYLARAKALIPRIRNRLISEATGTSARNSQRVRTRLTATESRREPGQNGAVPRYSGRGPINPKSVDWRNTSDEDFLNDRVTFRK
jgi:hypothetical protein